MDELPITDTVVNLIKRVRQRPDLVTEWRDHVNAAQQYMRAQEWSKYTFYRDKTLEVYKKLGGYEPTEYNNAVFFAAFARVEDEVSKAVTA